MSASPTVSRVFAAALVALLAIGGLACGAKSTPDDLEAEPARKPVPYTRRTVTTTAPPTSSAEDYRKRLLEGTGKDEPTPPEALTVPPSTARGSASTTTTAAGGASTSSTVDSSSTVTTAAAVSKQVCAQYSQFLTFTTEMLQLVDPADAAGTAAKLKGPMASSRAGLDQLLASPVAAVAPQTVAIINWLNNKAAGAVTDDPAFESAVNELRDWHSASC